MKPGKRSASIFIWLFLWAAWGSAFASPAPLNAGTLHCNYLADSLPDAAETYALTGKPLHGFKPAHSRAWYADWLGLKSVLEELLAKHPALIENQQLLGIAAKAQDSDSLEVFLTHGADPNATVQSRVNRTAPTLLYLAVSCQRSINVVYLLAAGANIYATGTPGVNAMAAVGYGDPDKQPWLFDIKRMMLLLAAGYDPRCPVDPGVTVLFFAKHALFFHEKQISGMTNIQPETKLIGRKLREIVAILQGVTAIREAQSTGPPRCGNTHEKSVGK